MKCDNGNGEINEKDPNLVKIHIMTHLLMEQLKKMAPECGTMAMIQLLVTNSLSSKDIFMQTVSDIWDVWNTQKSEK